MQANNRRQRLVPTDTSRGPAPRVVTVREISQMKVRVPYNLAETDSALMISVNPDGQLVPGLVNRKEIPRLYPIDDLTRLSSARAVVSSVESTLSKASALDDLKKGVICLLSGMKTSEDEIVIKPSTQSELMQIKPKVDLLRENEEAFLKNKLDETEFREQIQFWFSQSFKACELFVHSVCTGKDRKLADLLIDSGVPKWFFDRVAGAKHTELSQVTSFTFLFPKKLSKMIFFTVAELESPEFCDKQSLFRDRIALCRGYLTIHPEPNKKAVVYPLPFHFVECFKEFNDLPKYNRTDVKVTLLSVAVLHSLFGAFEPKSMTLENINLHHNSLLEERIKFLPDQVLKILNSEVSRSQDAFKSLPKDLLYEDILTFHLEKGLDKSEVEKLPIADAVQAFTAYYKELFVEREEGRFIFKSPEGRDVFLDPESTRNIRSQYLDTLREENLQTFLLRYDLLQLFGVTKSEKEALPLIVSSNPRPIQPYKKVESSKLFAKGIPLPKDTEKFLKKFEVISPAEPKLRDRGRPNSKLGKQGERFLTLLKNAKAHPTFVRNVESYLKLFHSQSFQDQAVKIMEASIVNREIVNFMSEEDAQEAALREQETEVLSPDDDNPLGGYF